MTRSFRSHVDAESHTRFSVGLNANGTLNQGPFLGVRQVYAAEGNFTLPLGFDFATFGVRAWFGGSRWSGEGSRLNEPVEPKPFEKSLFKKLGGCSGPSTFLGKACRCAGAV